MRRVVHKWNHVTVLENVSHCWQRGKQNTVVKRSELKRRENCSRKQGADVEAGCRVGVF